MAARRLFTAVAALALIAWAGLAWAHAARPPVPDDMARPSAEKPYVEGEMLVKFKPGVTPEQIRAFNARMNTVVVDEIKGLGVYRLVIPVGTDVRDMVARYQASGLVAFAEPNRKVSIPPMPGQKPPGGVPPKTRPEGREAPTAAPDGTPAP